MHSWLLHILYMYVCDRAFSSCSAYKIIGSGNSKAASAFSRANGLFGERLAAALIPLHVL